MKYDFDTVVNRRGTDASKWEVGPDELPMWVADMDFQTAPEICEALGERVKHGIFGYTDVPSRWRSAYVNWWQTRHGFAMEGEALIFCTGVIPAISSAVRKLTTPNEKVIVQTPVYNIFFNCIQNNGCRVSKNPLIYENGQYRMDFEDLEEKMADPQTTLMLLCNPHNPVGKIWDRETLLKVAELAERHHVTIISDEIHCDLTAPGKDYVPFASISKAARDMSIVCVAPTKAFNLAGIQTAAVYVWNPLLRHKIWRALNTDEVAEPNAFAVTAAETAFEKGGKWLDELREYLWENRRIVTEALKAEIPDVFVVEGDATYLLWIDVSALPGNSMEIAGFLRKKTGLYLTGGMQYGTGGEHHLRMNIACPKKLLNDGVERLVRGLKLYREMAGV